MKNLGADTQGFGEVGCADGLNHELLDVDVVVGMLTAIENVHHRHRHAVLTRLAIELGDMGIERHALGIGCRLGCRQRNSQNGVGTQLGLVVGTIEFEHGIVETTLVAGIHADKPLTDGSINSSYRLEYAFSQITAGITITQFQRFTGAGGSTTGSASDAQDTTFQPYLGLNSGVPTGIEHL